MVFLFLANGFTLSIIWANPFDWDYGPNQRVIQFIFSCAILFLNSIFTRCICKSNKRYVSFNEYDNRELHMEQRLIYYEIYLDRNQVCLINILDA